VALQTVNEKDSGVAQAMGALSRRLKEYAAEQADPTGRHYLRMSAELLQHLANLTTKLARPAEVPFGSGPAGA
jgi:hypothetical protein